VLKDADEILLMKSGAIIARGTFDRLMATSREFRELLVAGTVARSG
jgi:ABC-type multidrug transport system fused ATPase/permease subunit|tara:strand:+ start:47 stop:184 length:138 start_codon:yes stop_codon:yes gene_type:complete